MNIFNDILTKELKEEENMKKDKLVLESWIFLHKQHWINRASCCNRKNDCI